MQVFSESVNIGYQLAAQLDERFFVSLLVEGFSHLPPRFGSYQA
jgi:hypothetical protein